MKRIFYTIACCFVLLMMPIHVFATDGVEVSKTTLTIEQGTSVTFNLIATNSVVHVTYNLSDSSVISIDNVPNWIDSEPGESVSKSIKVNGLKAGTSTITFNTTTAVYDPENEFSKTMNVVVKVVPPKSSNANLKEIKIDGFVLSNFNASTTSYTLKNTDSSTMVINAITEDSKATVSGVGTKSLSYGLNTLKVVVTAENGNKKTYTLKVTRNDKRSNENTLSLLSVSVGNIDFDSNKTSYTLNVDEDVTEIKVDAKAKSSKASVSGIGTIKLKDGNNEIKVVVTAENGSKKTYTINVIKKTKDISSSELSSNNNLSSLVVDGYNINFDSNKETYYLNVDSSVTKLNINAISEDTKAKVVVNNIDNLVSGENIITINVTAENGDIKTYQILVNKGLDGVVESHSCVYKYLFVIETIILILLAGGFAIWFVKNKEINKKKNKRK